MVVEVRSWTIKVQVPGTVPVRVPTVLVPGTVTRYAVGHPQL